jgi:4-amino-4-deoxy-L-arabinose transferase-like glycosyltransferase
MSGSWNKKTIVSCMALVLMTVALCWALDGLLTEAPIAKDARQNLMAAYNLCAWGMFSIEPSKSEKPSPDNYREPVMPLVIALFMRAYAPLDRVSSFDDLDRGNLCRTIKRINLFWAFVLLLGSTVLVVGFTRSALIAALCVALIYAVFLRNPEHIDTLCTEIPTAAVMVWTSVLLTMCVPSGRRVLFFCAGALFGLLCLTKAVFLYLAVPIAFIVFVCNALAPNMKKMRSLMCVVLFMAGIVAAAGPWMLRNYMHFGSFNLTQRGGAVLYGRTLRNTMNRDEVIAAFYLWGPGAYKKMVKNTFFGMSREDYQEGGRAARLNRSADSNFAHKDAIAERAGKPEDAISFHSQGRAERARLSRQFESRGHPNPGQAADDYLKKAGFRWISKHPFRHALMTIPFAWRGAWCLYGGGIVTALNALCVVAFMLLAAYGLFPGNQRIAAFILLPFLMLFFNAVFTHNLSRYSSPAIPFLIISLVVGMYMLGAGLGKKSV